MNKCRLSFYNNFSTASNLDSDIPVSAGTSLSNLNSPLRSRVAGWSGNVTIDGNYIGTNQTGCFVIAQHTLPSTATYRVRLYSDVDLAGTVLYDSGVKVVGANEYLVCWSDNVAAKSFRLDITSLVSFTIGRIFMGEVFSPRISVAEQFANEQIDMSKQIRTGAGSLFVESQPAYNRMSFTLHSVDLDEYDYIKKAERYVGTRRDVFISLFPDNGDQLEYAHQGLFKLQTGIREQPKFVDRFSLQFQLEGV